MPLALPCGVRSPLSAEVNSALLELPLEPCPIQSITCLQPQLEKRFLSGPATATLRQDTIQAPPPAHTHREEVAKKAAAPAPAPAAPADKKPPKPLVCRDALPRCAAAGQDAQPQPVLSGEGWAQDRAPSHAAGCRGHCEGYRRFTRRCGACMASFLPESVTALGKCRVNGSHVQSICCGATLSFACSRLSF